MKKVPKGEALDEFPPDVTAKGQESQNTPQPYDLLWIRMIAQW